MILQSRSEIGPSVKARLSVQILLAAFAALLSSCSDPSQPVQEPGDILPLAIGNQWVGVWSENPTSGDPGPVVDTIRVTRDSIADGTRWFRTSGTIDSQPVFNDWLADDSVGVLHRLDLQSRVFKYPASLGDTLGTQKTKVLIPGSDSRHDPEVVDAVLFFKVTAVDSTISVPAGEFRCLAYRQFIALEREIEGGVFLRADFRYWMSPGVGPVRIERLDTMDNVLTAWELRDFSLQ